ncbi:hypothetical protein BDD12DRAFT_825860 [Trichophaea hybrida]|nr:hypothetical protein BDD12DRAFT_825860 [Trichophaea hybrida]
MCCQCGNSWMIVRDEDDTCTYSECGHIKCNGCTTVMMSTSIGFPSNRPKKQKTCCHGVIDTAASTAVATDDCLSSDDEE